MINTNYDVICFGAHPDDVEFAMGGTVLKLAEKGKKILLVVFTRGEKGTYGTPEEREQELIKACQLIGSDYHLLPWIDCEFENNYENKLELVKIIRYSKPKICFAPYHTHLHDHHNGAAHPDHLRCGLMVKDALRFARFKNILPEIEHHDVKRIFYYMIPRELKPSFVIDVSDKKDKLSDLMKCHSTQMNIRKGDKNALSLLTSYREMTGLYSYTGFSEAFFCEEILNIDVEELFFV